MNKLPGTVLKTAELRGYQPISSRLTSLMLDVPPLRFDCTHGLWSGSPS